jgi:very-short-patch-repair endonuclease/Zn finger protein HypA/HybF involved in hydrogenase expression
VSRNTKFTIDEIKEFLKKNFPQISLLKNQTYINRHQELKFSCKLHGEFSKPMIKISRGYHCPSCGKIRQGKKSVKELNDYLKKNLPLISLKKSQTYINNKVKMIFVCKKHGEFETTWNSITRGSNCQKCGIERKKLKRTTPIKEILEKIKLKHNGKIELINPNDYVNSHSKLKFKCEKHHPIWKTKVYSVLQGKGCPKCAGKNITTNEFISNIKSIHGDSISLANGEIYTGRTKKLKFDCNKCNKEFFASPNNIIFNKSGCPHCKGDKLRDHFAFSTDELLKIIKDKTRGEVIPYKNQEYVNQKTVWKFKCKKNPKHPPWETTVGIILGGSGCPTCSMSKGERKILYWLRDNNIKFEHQYRISKNRLNKYFIFDFYLPEKKIFIEFDGIQHFEPVKLWGGEKGLKKVQKSDSEKDKISKNMGCKMVRISYLSYDEIEQILRNHIT